MQHYRETIRLQFNQIVQSAMFKRIPQYIKDSRQEIDLLHDRLLRAVAQYIVAKKNILTRNSSHLNALSPLNILMRGYSIVYGKQETPVTSAGDLEIGEKVVIQFHRGRAHAEIGHKEMED